jgi:iron complex outermembrane receptor protein
MKNVIYSCIILFFFGQSMYGQNTDSTKISMLDPVAVTASLSPQVVSRTGRNILVIPGEKFSDLPVNSIDELLRYLPGIEVQMRGPAGSQSDIVMRGGTFQQVLVVIDGIRVNDANTGHFSSYIPLVTAEIERIEVLKGASSAIYGSDAVGGVIHIITHAFHAKQNLKKTKVDIKATVGQRSLFNLNAGIKISDHKSVLTAGVMSLNARGESQRGTTGYFHNNTASLSYGRLFGDKWHLALRSTWDVRDFAAQNFYTAFVSDTSSEKVKTSWSQLQLTHTAPTNQLQVDIGYKFLEDNFRFNPASTPNLSKSYLLQGLITDQWKLNGSTSITSGLQFVNKKISSNDRGRHDLDNAGLFLVLNHTIKDQLSVSPGVRIDWNERSGTQLVPQINLSYRIQKFQLRASAGKTTRDADFTERFNNYGRALVTSGRVGNPALDPERSFSYEAGADYLLSSGVKLSAGFFQRFHKDLIDYVTTSYADMPRKENLSPTGTYALARNISRVNTTGVETDIHFSKRINDQQDIWGTIGAVWLESKSNEKTPSLYISSHAKWLFTFNLHYNIQRWSLSMNGLYKKRQAQLSSSPVIAAVSPDYFILNVKLEAAVLKDKLGIFVQADNFLNRKYTDLLGSQMPGSWLMAGLHFTFDK